MAKKKILYLGNALSKHGFTPTTVETLSKRWQADFDVVVASNKKNKALRLLDMWWSVIWHHRTANLLVIDTYSGPAFQFAATCAKLAHWLSLPYVAFLHGGNLPEQFVTKPKQSLIYLQRAKHIVAPSGFLATAVTTHFNLPVKIVPNFIDLENYPNASKALGSVIRLLWVRSFHKIYNPDWAVKVVKLLKDRGQSVHLTMVGPDKDGSREVCEAAAKQLGVNGEIAFTGRLSKPEWIAEAENHNIFLNTTSADNTPVSVMEAMALGLPVVTTKVGGIPFLFEDGVEGIMVEDATPEKLATAIEALLQTAQRAQEIGAAARAKAENWDWLVIREKWIQILKK